MAHGARAAPSANERGHESGSHRAVRAHRLLFWVFIYILLYRLLAYFRGVPEIGPLLAGKLLGADPRRILLDPAAVEHHHRAVELLPRARSRPARRRAGGLAQAVRREAARDARALELDGGAAWRCRCSPRTASVYDGGPLFPLLVIGAFVPFLVIPAVIGSALTLLLVNVFPARRTRDILSVIAVLAAGGIVCCSGSCGRSDSRGRRDSARSSEFVTVLRTPTSPLLPSEWVQRAVMSWLQRAARPAARTICSGRRRRRRSCSARCCIAGSTRSDSARRRRAASAGRAAGTMGRVGARAAHAVRRRAARAGAEGGAAVLPRHDAVVAAHPAAVLVMVYVFNIKFLPLRGEGVTFFLVNVVPFLNLVLAGFVLASVAARFIFPGVSLEGRTFWLLRSSPMSVRELLWSKFWVGTTAAARARAGDRRRHRLCCSR